MKSDLKFVCDIEEVEATLNYKPGVYSGKLYINARLNRFEFEATDGITYIDKYHDYNIMAMSNTKAGLSAVARLILDYCLAGDFTDNDTPSLKDIWMARVGDIHPSSNERDGEILTEVWLRVGLNVQLTPTEYKDLMSGSPKKSTLIMKNILVRHQANMVGNCYDPETDKEFELNPINL